MNNLNSKLNTLTYKCIQATDSLEKIEAILKEVIALGKSEQKLSLVTKKIPNSNELDSIGFSYFECKSLPNSNEISEF